VIAGVDFSTRAIHAALIPLEHGNGEPPIVLRHEPIPESPDPLRRYYEARMATRRICADTDGHPVNLVIVEQPMGRFAVRPLWAMFGAIVGSVPGVASVTALDAQAWRRELGLPARLTKQAAIEKALDWLYATRAFTAPRANTTLSEHHADAILIALAGRQQNQRAWSEGAA